MGLSPDAPPAEELAPEGKIPLFQENQPLADQALEEVISLLTEATKLGPNVDEGTMLDHVETLGPRTASSLRTFALALTAGNFDTELGWSIPEQQTRRVSFKLNVAQEIARLVEARNLDTESSVIEGEMRTVSDLSAWVVDLSDGERVTIDGSEIAPDQANQLHIHSRVRIVAEVTPTRHVGGTVRYTYLAKTLQILS